ncbi:hypothetical protein PRIPAC_77993 [Pristionchus pacificus]|uniref:Uncharacterized protein n=1 Tax=Pristionchus pacificus TaxID=54126 RepID=A0A2A6BEH4_PRIPA|nr:hypothetical protein PRIPAC_77993 [Pristionchus pacificus]|eukprot:PDM64211.1 hypothetical protein PRIPAC_54455 [Pristionchus pacificus]
MRVVHHGVEREWKEKQELRMKRIEMEDMEMVEGKEYTEVDMKERDTGMKGKKELVESMNEREDGNNFHESIESNLI